ncbi:A24 family peptidase [Actinomyces sp. 565]|uniref:prepilin peptidase n=1 Tax=Actinomyces sp. 565 TaxID=2057794 RepID=UPI0013A706BD|nr:A24 family peptidase [Actinomyces sp. 565]NDR53303.1 prepilin peptidase [Actinomyces sp. 565]
MVNAAAVLPVVAACLTAVASVGVAAWPASGFARAYVDGLERAVENQDQEDSADAATATARIRFQRLLDPLPQGALATLLCAVTLVWGLGHGAVVDTALALPVVALLGVAGSVDAVCHRLPNRLLVTAALWLLAVMAIRALGNMVLIAPSAAEPWTVGRAVLCALGAGAAILAMWLIPASGMGLGDVKLCALLGLWLGYIAVEWVVTGLILGFILAGLMAIGLLLTRRAGRKDKLAFGPYLAAGGWLAWLLAVA